MWNKLKGKLQYTRFHYLNWWKFKWIIWALFNYFKIVIKMRPWDYSYVLQMMKFQLELLKKEIERGCELEIHKKIKIRDINRVCEIIDHTFEPSYYIDFYENKYGEINCNFELIDSDEEGYKELNDLRTVQEKELHTLIYKSADKLEQKEWNELINILRDGNYVKKRRKFKAGMKSWWV